MYIYICCVLVQKIAMPGNFYDICMNVCSLETFSNCKSLEDYNSFSRATKIKKLPKMLQRWHASRRRTLRQRQRSGLVARHHRRGRPHYNHPQNPLLLHLVLPNKASLMVHLLLRNPNVRHALCRNAEQRQRTTWATFAVRLHN